MYCTRCGKQINDSAVICVNCGVATRNFNAVAEVRKTVEEKKVNGFGIAGFVVGLLSLGLGFYLCVASIIGLSLSIVGMTQMKKCNVNGLAIAGLILSIISLMFWLTIWITMACIGVLS